MAAAPVVVAIGGSDPSAGAGIQADVRTLDSFHVAAMTVVTAVTVQAGLGVKLLEAVPPDLVARQLRILLTSFSVKVLKCGLLPNESAVRSIARVIRRYELLLVLDPVLKPSQGGRLTAPGVAEAIIDELLPMTTVLTANLGEAAALTGAPVNDVSDMKAAAADLAAITRGTVIVKGGDLPGRPVDVCLIRGKQKVFAASRLRPRYQLHGTGCAYASAIAAGLARGMSIERCIRRARAHVRSLIRGATPIRGSSVLLRQPPGT